MRSTAGSFTTVSYTHLAYDTGGKAFSQSNANPINHYVNQTVSAYAPVSYTHLDVYKRQP